MPNPSSRLFTQTDLDRITAAIKEAESKTSGEIVPYVVERSDAYENAYWRAALLFALVTLAGFVAVHQFAEAWLPDLEIITFAVTLAAGLGLLLVNFIPALKRLFAGSNILDLRVYRRAAEAFIEEEIFNTRDRTGVLIFISLLERRVRVIGDSAINAKVEPSEWNEVKQSIVAGVRAGRTAEGLIEAIQQCGVLLQQNGIERRADDTDEISSRLRMGERVWKKVFAQ
jgi:putative membrane protein